MEGKLRWRRSVDGTVVGGVPLVGFLGSFVQGHRVYGFDGLAVEIDVYWRIGNSVLITYGIYLFKTRDM